MKSVVLVMLRAACAGRNVREMNVRGTRVEQIMLTKSDTIRASLLRVLVVVISFRDLNAASPPPCSYWKATECNRADLMPRRKCLFMGSHD